MMYKWTGAFPLEVGASEVTVCEGDVIGTTTGGVKGDTRTTYCSAGVFPKEYTQTNNK
jgi:hypothetical protein